MQAIGRALSPFIISTLFSIATTAESAASPKRQFVWFVFVLMCMPSMLFGEKVIEDNNAANAVKPDWDEEHELLTPSDQGDED